MEVWNYKNSDVLNSEWGEPVPLLDGIVRETNNLLELVGLPKIDYEFSDGGDGSGPIPNLQDKPISDDIFDVNNNEDIFDDINENFDDSIFEEINAVVVGKPLPSPFKTETDYQLRNLIKNVNEEAHLYKRLRNCIKSHSND